MPAITYRPFHGADLEAVATVWMASWRSTGISFPPPFATLQEYRERIARELLADWRITVVCEGDDVAGFMATKPDNGELDQLFISPAAQGRGLGKGLLKIAMREMPGGFWLRAVEANRAACAFYEAQGLLRDRVEPHPTLGHPTAIYVCLASEE